MAINLNKVNISLNEFQRLSNRRAQRRRGEARVRFHWTTTVALDGTVTSTPLTIEPPPQPANA